MDWDHEMKLTAQSRVGKEVWVNARETGLATLFGIVEDEVGIVVDGAKHVIQRIRLAEDASRDGEKYGYRTGSFVIDLRTGHVKFGQYSHVLLEGEYRELLQRAKAKGWPVV